MPFDTTFPRATKSFLVQFTDDDEIIVNGFGPTSVAMRYGQLVQSCRWQERSNLACLRGTLADGRTIRVTELEAEG